MVFDFIKVNILKNHAINSIGGEFTKIAAKRKSAVCTIVIWRCSKLVNG